MKNDNWFVVAGTFDLFHPGHIEILAYAHKLGKVCAVVNTDRFVEEFKKKPPVMTLRQRLFVVNACRYVDWGEVNDNADLTIILDKLIPSLRPVVGIVFGSDYSIEAYRKQTQITETWQHKHGIALIQYPRVSSHSSRSIALRT